ncbi:type II toxin-antitoxin system PemK/MazF family toxin [Paenibacillus jiagnxiensis]|uniref:type II toxin-antitoxin system PemK/MazF family toxin n=1 Tax=Paenibacillus jiagnxiensis TaxID=3228926 RepID=UPI0033BBFB26
MPEFERGDVFGAYVPPIKDSIESPRPSYILEGYHKFVMMHDSSDRDLPGKSVVAIPITSLDKGTSRVPPSYVELDKDRHPFLNHDSYISTHQPISLSRQWLGEVSAGKIHPDKMLEVDLQMIRTVGLEQTLHGLIAHKLKEQLQEFERGMDQAAASRERPRGPER